MRDGAALMEENDRMVRARETEVRLRVGMMIIAQTVCGSRPSCKVSR